MKFVNGIDHNIGFRFTKNAPINNWYDLHFQSPGEVILERVDSGVYNFRQSYSFPNGSIYHIKIVINENNIKFYVENKLIFDYSSFTDRFSNGRIVLRATNGSDTNSETYFDNIKVTSIDDILNVPLWKQTADPWQGLEYDSALT